ncbi:MAG: DegT/DnrJ/EryC1/StrS family aminotransferase [Elusimicrobia bacterium]|nr:DegT/DnrJ/EryC1/StrS family aminotransferase [Elusimicrobiota bacterium]
MGIIKIPVARPELNGNELKYVVRCVKDNWISSIGSFVQKFENEFADFCGTKYAVSAFNGTVALHLALVSLEIGKGDEVIVPDLTFVATANTVSYTGAKPVFVDIDKRTWCIDTEKIEKKITRRTKAIIPVHLYGHPANMERILDIARKHKLYVIEDAAEAHGAEVKFEIRPPAGGSELRIKKVGSIGDVGCFSFYGNKIITTGEGGMIVTNSKKAASAARFLRNQAMLEKRKYFHPKVGFNYRMTNLQAAIGCAQLEKINIIISKKRQIAKTYEELLMNVKGITLPVEEEWAKNVYWMYTIVVGKEYGISSTGLARKLLAEGIETRPVFYPMHLLPDYKTKGDFKVSTTVARCGLTLPSGSTLKTSDIEYIVKLIKRFRG